MKPAVKSVAVKVGTDVALSLLGQFAEWLKGRPAVWQKRREARRERRASK